MKKHTEKQRAFLYQNAKRGVLDNATKNSDLRSPFALQKKKIPITVKIQ